MVTNIICRILKLLCCTGLKYNEWIIVSCEIHEHNAGKFRVQIFYQNHLVPHETRPECYLNEVTNL